MRHPTPKSSFESAPSSTKSGRIPRLPLGTGVIWGAVIPVPPRRDGNDWRFERHPVPNDTTTQNVGSSVEMKERDSSKLDERRGDVYENKGSAFHSPRRSGNVYENTST